MFLTLTTWIAKFDGLEPWRCKDIRRIAVPEMGPKRFGTFEKEATDSILQLPKSAMGGFVS